MSFLTKVYYSFLRPILASKRATIGFIITIGFILMAIIGPEIVPLDLTTRYELRFQPPSLEHPLGTDFAGRDTFAQIVHGSREVLLIAFLAALYAILIAISVGMTSGYIGGKVDLALMSIVDIFLTIPNFPIMLAIAATFRVSDPASFAAIISIWMWAGLSRAIRAEIMSLKQKEFIEASKVLGMSNFHIIFRELMPNVFPYILINFITMIRAAITASVGIMFLGVVPFKITHWGVMLNLALFQSGAIYFKEGIYYALSPLIFIVLLEFGAVNLSHGLEEVFNPRLKTYE
ncbi:MAG TPA: ABC transporter permease [Thermofilum sp.]|nr:ABC transporter permease [Thermofilum sp.]